MNSHSVEVVIVGGGPAGLTAAIALAGAGVQVALIAKSAGAADNRTTALLASSVTALDVLGVWPHCRAQAAPLRVLRIIDDTGRLLRAPEVHFSADEIGLDAFGQNIENRFLVAALEARARMLPALTFIADKARAIRIEEDHVAVELGSAGTLTARLAIGADGRRSLCRQAAGIATDARHYPQTALTFNLRHQRPHREASTEFHTEDGPFTLVPLPGLRSSLVLVTNPGGAVRIGGLSNGELAMDLERRSHSILGTIAPEAGHGAFPLAIETARRFAVGRVALIGEAAHLLPPIGAQGLNLGLRDAAAIAELVVAARRAGSDVGAADLADRYDISRRADVSSRALAVDLVNRSLLTDFLPMQGMRGLGLFLMQHVGPLRRAVMREGVSPAAAQPRLMRGEAL
ncbi:MAG TPA: UbiH/UbiF family hydroxylase [Xanthobacteraceae bacterium]|nr:UbiH/UbiF family hydroxylase [Xanthobacteraceae bacterium]